MWEVLVTDEFREWYEELAQDDQEPIRAAMGVLERRGPNLKRPLVGEILSSRHKNMKELIPPATDIRILFVFDPRRNALMLLGGDKAGTWDDWYLENVPHADDLYDEYLEGLRKEGVIE
jgi:hypothetical protein